MSARRNKYGAQRTWGQGRCFDSKGEKLRHDELMILQRGGFIGELSCQPRVQLVAGITYVPDFRYIEKGKVVYEDFKGTETAVFKLKAKLWTVFGPGKLRITKRDGGRTITVREILPTQPNGENK